MNNTLENMIGKIQNFKYYVDFEKQKYYDEIAELQQQNKYLIENQIAPGPTEDIWEAKF